MNTYLKNIIIEDEAEHEDEDNAGQRFLGFVIVVVLVLVIKSPLSDDSF